jgi:hypothetical protein
MKYRVVNRSNLDMDKFRPLLKSFLPFAREKMGFNKPVSIHFVSDPENAKHMLGKTAFYDPSNDSVSIYTDNRHPKDILRSLSHELIHHAQNCRGEFDYSGDLGEDYFQNDPHMHEMELEAYKDGNRYFRMWEEKYREQLQESIYYTGEKPMKRIDSRRNSLNSLLMEKYGYEPAKELEEEELTEDAFAGNPELDNDEDGAPKWGDKDDDDPEVQQENKIREAIRQALRGT